MTSNMNSATVGPLAVLVIDSRADELQASSEQLIRHACRVEGCRSAEEAAAALQRRCERGIHHDLVLLDWQLSDGQGPIILRRLLHYDPEPAWVLCTALKKCRQDDLGTARRLGVSQILDKPLQAAELQGLLQRIQRKKAAAAHPGTQRFRNSAGTATIRRHRVTELGPRGDETPFFGTSRIGEAGGSFTPAGGSQTLPPDNEQQSSTSRYRRAPALKPGSTRIRRGVTGRMSAEDAQATSKPVTTIHVRCHACNRPFTAGARKRSYALPCIHCGQLNTIPAQG